MRIFDRCVPNGIAPQGLLDVPRHVATVVKRSIRPLARTGHWSSTVNGRIDRHAQEGDLDLWKGAREGTE